MPETCISCRRPQADQSCGLCGEMLCKKCALTVAEDAFQFRKELPIELEHDAYCAACFAQTVQPELDAYAELLERARGVFFFFTSQKKQIPLVRKSKEAVKVENCVDRDETILRLGYQAAEQGYNAIMEGEVKHEKVRDHGWQKTAWNGTGIPAEVDAERLEAHLNRGFD